MNCRGWNKCSDNKLCQVVSVQSSSLFVQNVAQCVCTVGSDTSRPPHATRAVRRTSRLRPACLPLLIRPIAIHGALCTVWGTCSPHDYLSFRYKSPGNTSFKIRRNDRFHRRYVRRYRCGALHFMDRARLIGVRLSVVQRFPEARHVRP